MNGQRFDALQCLLQDQKDSGIVSEHNMGYVFWHFILFTFQFNEQF